MKYKVNWNLDFGKSKYREGDVISESAIPDSQLDVLKKCGVISPIAEPALAPAPAAPKGPADATPGASQTLPIDELAKLSKAMLADYAKEQFGVALDPPSMTKDAMLVAIAEMAEKAN